MMNDERKKERRCRNCAYSVVLHGQGHDSWYECRRFPVFVSMLPNDTRALFHKFREFPIVADDLGNETTPPPWCGEFRHRYPDRIPIEKADLSVRARHTLDCLGVLYLQDAADLTFPQLRNEHNCGAITIAEIQNALRAIGLDLRPNY